MKQSEKLKQQLNELKELENKKLDELKEKRKLLSYKEWDKAWDDYYKRFGKKFAEEIRGLEREINTESNREIEVGDGVTMCLYSDAYACTVIAKTAKTITIQRDNAKLDPNFKPEFIPGGFAAHCTNQEDQRWTYERNPDGQITRCYWSEILGMYTTGGDRSIKIRLGRHEFYDYNF